MAYRGWILGTVALLLLAGLSGCLGDDDSGVDPDGSGGDGTGVGSGDGGSGDGGDGGLNLSGDPPTASFAVVPSDPVFPGDNVSFDASASSDPEGTNLTYTWDLGDGNTTTGMIVNYTYGSAGNFTVNLTVTDEDGQTASANATVTVLLGSFSETYTGSIAAGNPAVAVVPAGLSDAGAGGSDLENYRTACSGQGDCAEHEVTGVPRTGGTLTFDMTGTGTGDLNYVVFDPDGNRLDAAGSPSSSSEKLELTGDDANFGDYTILVYGVVGASLGYSIDVTL